MTNAKKDENGIPVLMGVSNVDGVTPVMVYVDPVTHRLLVDFAGGSGTVTSVSVVTANGISGSVATATTTPAITLTLGAITPSSVQVSGLTASQILSTDASKNLTSLDVATYPSLTELSYVKGVTSAIQTQINAKGAGTVTAVSVASANGFAGTSSGGATPALTLTTSITGILKGNATAISAATAGSDYAVGSLGLAGGQTIAGSTLTTENLTLRANAADLTTGQVNVTSSKEATNTTTASVALAGGLAVAKRIYSLDMTVTNTITGTTSGNLVSGGALGTPSSATLTNATGLPIAGLVASTSTALGVGSIELGHATDTTIARVSAGVISVEGVTVDTATNTLTLTNKRITPRVLSAASYTTDTGTSLNCDNLDEFIVTAQAGALKLNNPTGTPTDGQVLFVAVTGTAARALTYDTQFEASTVALPTTTVTTARLNMLFIWRADTSKWVIIATA